MSKYTKHTDNSNGSMGCTTLFIVLLQTLFIGLKLTDQIDWSWFKVFTPTFIYVGVILFVIVLILVLFIATKD